ncbi:hypothetical protein V497_00164 [Pseudogymnoascus sp. VKM F-4516 (FW-969)]|nr:hypothetical protein V497_00164 [Pseudogymnoascus sp. VKM F-4516 (FW-969)]
MVWADYDELRESAIGPVENTTVENTAPVNDTPLVEDTAPVNDTPVENTAPVNDTPVENTAPVNDTPLVEDTPAVNDTPLVEDTSAPVEDTETECVAPNSVSSSPAAIATGQYTHTVTILDSNLGVGSYRGLASGTQAEALTSVPASSASAPAVNDPVSKRNYEEYLDSCTETEADKGNKRVKTDSDSEPTGDAS